jgi:Phage related hypothetical protein (DUF1799)
MAARAWVTGSLDAAPPLDEEDGAVADARRMGASEEQIEALIAWQAHQDGLADGDGVFTGVWPQHVPAFTAFLAAATQWRTTLAQFNGLLVTRYTGLDYAGAAIAWAARKIEVAGEIFDQLTVIETAARDALNGVQAGVAS